MRENKLKVITAFVISIVVSSVLLFLYSYFLIKPDLKDLQSLKTYSNELKSVKDQNVQVRLALIQLTKLDPASSRFETEYIDTLQIVDRGLSEFAVPRSMSTSTFMSTFSQEEARNTRSKLIEFANKIKALEVENGASLDERVGAYSQLLDLYAQTEAVTMLVDFSNTIIGYQRDIDTLDSLINAKLIRLNRLGRFGGIFHFF